MSKQMCSQGQRLRLEYLQSPSDERDLTRALWQSHAASCPTCRAWWDEIAQAAPIVPHREN